MPWLPKEEKEIDYRAWDEALAKRAAAKHKLVELTERAEREEAK